jgi:O-antigen ligase
VTRSRLADAVGAALLLLVAIAVVMAALVDGAGNPWPALAAAGVAAAGYIAGRLSARVLPVVAVLVVGALLLLFIARPTALSGAAGAPPLHYANADAALYVQVAALAACVAAGATQAAWRALGALVTGALVVVTFLTGSLAGLVTGAAVLAALLVTLAGRAPPRRLALAVGITLVLATHVAVLVLGATSRPGRPETVADTAAASSLSQRRLALWSDAVAIAADHPLTGVGPREFPVVSPTARADTDTREAHSVTLQMAAETGWPGAAAVLLLLLWAVARPLVDTPADRPGVVITATAAGALAVHASIDYVLGFPAVVAVAAFVLGAGTSEATPGPVPPLMPRSARSPRG